MLIMSPVVPPRRGVTAVYAKLKFVRPAGGIKRGLQRRIAPGEANSEQSRDDVLTFLEIRDWELHCYVGLAITMGDLRSFWMLWGTYNSRWGDDGIGIIIGGKSPVHQAPAPRAD